nr:interleukin-37 isoform X2 [Oryctolagus cuniculus]
MNFYTTTPTLIVLKMRTSSRLLRLRKTEDRVPHIHDRATDHRDSRLRSFPRSHHLLIISLMSKMSLLEKNSGVKMDSEDGEKAEPQDCSGDPAGSPQEPGPSFPSVDSVQSSKALVKYWSSSESLVKFQEPEKFNIRDGDQKVLVLDCEILKAIPHKAYILPETFFVLASYYHSAPPEKGSPILLAVSKGELCLCCVKAQGKIFPSLQLKKKKLEDLVTEKEQAQRPFVFYKADVGSRSTLESAAHTGWFLCTSCSSGEPVRLTKTVGRKKQVEFHFIKL